MLRRKQWTLRARSPQVLPNHNKNKNAFSLLGVSCYLCFLGCFLLFLVMFLLFCWFFCLPWFKPLRHPSWRHQQEILELPTKATSKTIQFWAKLRAPPPKKTETFENVRNFARIPINIAFCARPKQILGKQPLFLQTWKQQNCPNMCFALLQHSSKYTWMHLLYSKTFLLGFLGQQHPQKRQHTPGQPTQPPKDSAHNNSGHQQNLRNHVQRAQSCAPSRT